MRPPGPAVSYPQGFGPSATGHGPASIDSLSVCGPPRKNSEIAWGRIRYEAVRLCSAKPSLVSIDDVGAFTLTFDVVHGLTPTSGRRSRINRVLAAFTPLPITRARDVTYNALPVVWQYC